MRKTTLSAQALFVTVSALVLYAVTTNRGFTPGFSAMSVLQALPGSDDPVYRHPIWNLCIRAVAALPLGPMALRLNLFSALIGAASVGLLFLIATHLRHNRSHEESGSPISPGRLSGVTGWAAVLFFAPCLPVWLAATRPMPTSFGLALLLAVVWLSLITFDRRSPRLLCLCAFAWGIAVVEFASAWIFLPGFGVAALLTGFDVYGRFRWNRNLRLAGFFLLGCLLYGVTAWVAVKHPNAQAVGMGNYGNALWETLRGQKRLLADVIPRDGWLAVLLSVGIPFLVVVMPHRQISMAHRWGSVLFHLVCTVVVVLMLFHPPFSPWSMFGLSIPLVTPYAVVALTGGYLAGYWLAVCSKVDVFQRPWVTSLRRLLRAMVVPCVVLIAGVASVLNFQQVRSPSLASVNLFARDMAAQMQPYHYVVDASPISDVLMLELRARGSDVRVLQPRLMSRDTYRQILANTFSTSVRLRSMAMVGPIPFLQTWAAEPGFGDTVLLTDMPDLAYRAERIPQPTAYGYRAVSTLDLPTMEAEFAERLAFWASLDPATMRENENGDQVLGGFRLVSSLLDMQSRLVNNFGFLLEGEGRMEGALTAYREARRLNPANLSALLNLLGLQAHLPEEESASLRAEFDRIVESLGTRRYAHWRLSAAYGYVSHPDAYMERGQTWAVTGRPNMAIGEMKRAIEREGPLQQFRLQLAYAYLQNKDFDASEAQYVELLTENPNNPSALLGLSRIHVMRGQLDEARGLLERLEQQHVNPNLLRNERLALEISSGNYAEAEQLVEAWLKTEPENAQALVTRALIAVESRDTARVKRVVEQLRQNEHLATHQRLALAYILLRERDVKSADELFRQVLQRSGGNIAALEGLLRIAVVEVDRAKGFEAVQRLLAEDPENAYGNFVLGTLQFVDNKLDAAISSFETSLRAERTASTLNHLSFAYQMARRFDEALPLAEEAAHLSGRAPAELDTLATAYLGLGRLPEALETQQEALSKSPDDPELLIHLVEILLAMEREADTRDPLSRLIDVLPRLSVDRQEKVRDLRAQAARMQ